MDRFAKRKATQERHKGMTCKVFDLKVDSSKLSEKSLIHLNRLFKEAKWFYNYCLSQKDVNDADTKAKSVQVKTKDQFETRQLNALSGQMKQGIKSRLFRNLISLRALKQKGHKVGRLKFKSDVDSIPLKQFKQTFFVDANNGRVKIQGLEQRLLVSGMEQIPEKSEIACAVLVRKSNSFHFHITTYEEKVKIALLDASIGIDFGCQTQLTFSNGIKIGFQVPATKRLRRLDRRLARKSKTSKNRFKTLLLRRRECEKIADRKRDIRHKVVSAITRNFKYVCFQDESIHAWMAGGHGRKIQDSGIGGIMEDLKHKSHTPLMVRKDFPSTQLCPMCGARNRLGLSDRVYRCPCGYVKDRDTKSAICIKTEGLKQTNKEVIPADRRELTLGESSASTAFIDSLMKISELTVSKPDSKNQEAIPTNGRSSRVHVREAA